MINCEFSLPCLTYYYDWVPGAVLPGWMHFVIGGATKAVWAHPVDEETHCSSLRYPSVVDFLSKKETDFVVDMSWLHFVGDNGWQFGITEFTILVMYVSLGLRNDPGTSCWVILKQSTPSSPMKATRHKDVTSQISCVFIKGFLWCIAVWTYIYELYNDYYPWRISQS